MVDSEEVRIVKNGEIRIAELGYEKPEVRAGRVLTGGGRGTACHGRSSDR